eukprot:1151010-Pyramimonas_sp.AAC.1
MRALTKASIFGNLRRSLSPSSALWSSTPASSIRYDPRRSLQSSDLAGVILAVRFGRDNCNRPTAFEKFTPARGGWAETREKFTPARGGWVETLEKFTPARGGWVETREMLLPPLTRASLGLCCHTQPKVTKGDQR